ncbi:MAG: diguanylate cyclase [Desulfuromonadales bacterium]|nr:diguanylate cyclase [Desulfuromonadales bacterium]
MKKILIIDEIQASRLALKNSFGSDYIVIEAENGMEALQKVETDNPDIIILDMERYENDGPEICKLLKVNNKSKYKRLIQLYNVVQEKEIVNGLHAGADDYMTKPVNVNELLVRVETHLRTKDYYVELDKKDLLILLELTELISVTRNPKKILEIIVEKIIEAIDVSRCSIININDQGEMVVLASTDLEPGQEIKLDLKNYPEIEAALITQRAVVVQDIKNNPIMAPVKDKIKGLSDKAIFIVPIIKKNNVIGTFFMRASSPLKGGITERIFKLCQVVANLSGNALENAVLFESMQTSRNLLEELSLRDSLTKLYNHQYYHTRFEEEFSRAQRYKQDLSCVFIDIDEFKSVNDRFGHITGDIVLGQIGRLIKQVLRKSDMAARYGGEEFAVLLPNTGSEGAHEFAGRLLSLVRELEIPQLKGEHITISIGISTYSTGNVGTYEELLRGADVAMYQAKELGKDRICHATIRDQPNLFKEGA